MCAYQNNGYENRKDYLTCLADDYGVELSTVIALASMLGKEEDFDGLLAELSDLSMLGGF